MPQPTKSESIKFVLATSRPPLVHQCIWTNEPPLSFWTYQYNNCILLNLCGFPLQKNARHNFWGFWWAFNWVIWPPFSQGTWSQFHVQSFFSGCQCNFEVLGTKHGGFTSVRIHGVLGVSPSIKGETRQLAKSRKPIWWIRVWLANFLVICESAIMMVRPGSSGEEWIVWEPPLKIQIIERRGSFERLSSGSSAHNSFPDGNWLAHI